MKLKIDIEMDNAAFEDKELEAARILADLASRMETGQLGVEPGNRLALMDVNGNRVGEARVTR